MFGIAIGHLLSQHSKRRKLAVWAEHPRILIDSADHLGLKISAVVNGQAVPRLNRQTFTVLNTGPNAVRNIVAAVAIKPTTSVFYVQVSDGSSSVDILENDDSGARQLNCDFLNPRENITIDVVYAGVETAVDFQLRMPDVEVRKLFVKGSNNRAEIMLAIIDSMPMGKVVRAIYAPIIKAMF